MSTTIKIRRDTAANWTSVNPTLAAGEIGLETDTGQIKIGDGATAWTSQGYGPQLGAVTISGLLTLAGGQVAFPAVQKPSADPNTLDDYEEGSWTPLLEFGASTTGITYNAQSGTYTKIGNRVFWACDISLGSKGSATGSATIDGLPFVQSGPRGTTSSFVSNMTFTGSLQAMISGSVIGIYAQSGGANSQLTDTAFNAGTSQIALSGHYDVS